MGRPKGSKNLDDRQYREKVEAVLRFLHSLGTNYPFPVTNEQIGEACGFPKPRQGAVNGYLRTLVQQGRISIRTKKTPLSNGAWENLREIIALAEPQPAMSLEEWKRRDFAVSLSRYGLTIAKYEEILAGQGGVCGICKGPPNGQGKKTGRYCVDHDHDTGKVRGLLCIKCNIGLGYFKDSVASLQQAVVYLQKEER